MASQLQFERLRSWLSTFYDLYQVWSLGSLTTASFDTCMVELATGWLQNVPRPFGVALTDLTGHGTCLVLGELGLPPLHSLSSYSLPSSPFISRQGFICVALAVMKVT